MLHPYALSNGKESRSNDDGGKDLPALFRLFVIEETRWKFGLSTFCLTFLHIRMEHPHQLFIGDSAPLCLQLYAENLAFQRILLIPVLSLGSGR